MSFTLCNLDWCFSPDSFSATTPSFSSRDLDAELKAELFSSRLTSPDWILFICAALAVADALSERCSVPALFAMTVFLEDDEEDEVFLSSE